MAKNLTLTLSQFLVLGETQAKILAMQGYQINIVDNNVTSSINDRSNPQPVVSNANKQATVSKTNSNKSRSSSKGTTTTTQTSKGSKNQNSTKGANNKTSKGSSKSSSKGNKDNPQKSLPKGNLKVGDFFKNVNLKTGKVNFVGIVESIVNDDKYGNIVTPKGVAGKKFAVENCAKITDKTYKKLLGRLPKEKGGNKSSSSLTAEQYKLAFAFYLKELGKITDNDFAKAKDEKLGHDYLKELYSQFHKEIAFDNAKARDIFNKNTSSETSTKVEASSSTEETKNA